MPDKTINFLSEALPTAILTALCAAAVLAQSAYAQTATQRCNDKIEATTPTSRFTINTDNTVTDTATGLTWMRCTLGLTGADCRGGTAQTYTWATALNEVAQNHSGWRVPNIKELASIVELQCASPSINTTVFPNTTTAEPYWSSSPLDNVHTFAVSFLFGRVTMSQKNSGRYVRLVRNGQ